MSLYNKLYIQELVNQCSYPNNTKEFIINILFELTKQPNSKLNKFMRNVLNLNQYIIVIRYSIPTILKDKNFEIPILIYLPSVFPYEAPEIYIEKSNDNVEINSNNKDINLITNRIIVQGLQIWNTNSNIFEIINQIRTSFNNAFPIYQVRRDSYDSIKNETINNEESVKLYLIEQIKKNCICDIYEEIKNCQQESIKLNYYKNSLSLQINNINSVLDKKEEMIKYFNKSLFSIEEHINTNKIHLEKISKNIIKNDNFEDFISLPNDIDKQIINLISQEAFIDEYLIVVKKSFQKEIISFSETVKIIRTLSRELFKIKFYKEKVLNIKN